MIEAIFSDRTQQRCARIGLLGGAVIPTVLSLAVIVTARPSASAESQASVERALCVFWGMHTSRCLWISALVYSLEIFALAGVLWYGVSHTRPARQAAACAVVFVACYVVSTYAAMMVARPVVFVLSNLWGWMIGFA